MADYKDEKNITLKFAAELHIPPLSSLQAHRNFCFSK